MTAPPTPVPDAPAVLFEERLGAPARTWWWLAAIVAVTALAIAPIIVPIAAGAWLVNVLRYRRSRVRVDADRLWVGRRSVALAGLDLTTLGRAGNTWPWKVFDKRYLAANPIWTRDSIAVRGIEGGRPCWIAVGTDRRDELLGVLELLVPEAQATAGPAAWAAPAAAVAPPGWHDDPWDPKASLRWWDGAQWTGHVTPKPGGSA